MNSASHIPEASGSSLLGLLLVIGLACWCWLGRGPFFLRWPLVVVIVLMTSGHQFGGVIGSFVDALAPPVLTLVIVLAGIMIMLRGVRGGGGRSGPRHDYHRRGGRYDRWI